jgi:tetratricopeptide (TPR) repeat protein
LGSALRQRGANVRFLACDGLFPTCDVHRRNNDPRKVNSCNECQLSAVQAMSEARADFRWLSRSVPPELFSLARQWADELEVEQLIGAQWKQHPVAQWALSSALYQQRRPAADWSDAVFVRTFREQLYGTVLAFEAACHAFDEFQPDLLVLLNGRFFAHRAALEVARERGVRFVTHERGLLKNTTSWRDGELKHELDGERRRWQAVEQQALEVSQIDFVERVMHERRHGQGMSWDVRYSPPPEERAALLAKLNLDERPIVALFTSSEDEQAAFSRWAEGAFADGSEWLEATLEIAHATPTHQFVIRMHPALVSLGANEAALAHAQDLASRLPENCRLVLPSDDVSSYTLADAAALGIVYYTTMGLEMAVRGQPVLCVVSGWYAHAGFAKLVSRKEHYAAAIAAELGRGRDLEIARRAMRFAWQAFGVWSLPFRMVIEEPMHTGKRTYTKLAELVPGSDAQLDQLCEFLLDKKPLFVGASQAASAEQLDVETQRLRQSVAAVTAQPTFDALLEQIVAAEQAFGAGQSDRACELLLEVLEQDPSATRAWKDLAAILHAGGHHTDAMAALEQALLIDPDDQDARCDLELVRGAR